MMSEHHTGCVVLPCAENVPARQRGGREKKTTNKTIQHYTSPAHPAKSEWRLKKKTTSARVVGKRDVLPPHEELGVPVFGSKQFKMACVKKTLWCHTQLLCHR